MRDILIKNKFDEELDVVIEGNNDAETTIVFVHGFGMQKDETDHYFVDISNALKDMYRIVRFDFSGYGVSQGKQEESDFKKQASDLEHILKWVLGNFKGNIYIVAHSLGCFVTAFLSPDFVKKNVFTSIPNAGSDLVIRRLEQYFEAKPGAKIVEDKISFIPRSTGEIQKIGQSFWSIFHSFKPIEKITRLSKKTKLLVIKQLQDEIFGTECFEDYKKIPGIVYVEVNGNHSFKNPLERYDMIERIKLFIDS